MTLAENSLSVSKILAALEAGETKPARVIGDALGRIDEVDDEVLAFVARAPAETIAAAANATGPLAGIPFGAKDIFDTLALRTIKSGSSSGGNKARRGKGGAALGRSNKSSSNGNNSSDSSSGSGRAYIEVSKDFID